MAIQSFTPGQTALVSVIAVTAFGLGLAIGNGDDSNSKQTGSVQQGAGVLAPVWSPDGYPAEGERQRHAYGAAGSAANDSRWGCLRTALGEARQPASVPSAAGLPPGCVTVTVVSSLAGGGVRPAG